MDKETKEYLDLLSKLIIEARTKAFEIKRVQGTKKTEQLIDLLEVSHNIPSLIAEQNHSELKDWLKIFMHIRTVYQFSEFRSKNQKRGE